MTTARGFEFGRGEADREADEYGLDDPSRIQLILERLRPDEGWVALPLVLLLAGTMAWSMADARWILGEDGLTSFLVWIGLAAALWGYLSARLDLPPWLAQAIGCVVGAFVIVEAVGASIPGSGFGLGSWFHATAVSVTQAYLDLTWRHQSSTPQVGHFCLILGIVVWATAQAASYDVFGYRRAVNGVLLLAVVFIANMALTENDQFNALVVFSGSALVLLLLSHAADERASWLRHRIWRGRDFEAPHLQGGLAFASVAVAGSLVLTLVASSAPLGGAVQELGSQVQTAVGQFQGLLPNGGESRFQGDSDFGTTTNITPIFRDTMRNVFTVRDASSQMAVHWRLVAYDTFQTRSWAVGSNTRQDAVMAGQYLADGTMDEVSPDLPGRVAVSITVHIQDTSMKHLVAANEPASVNVGVQRTLVGSDPASLDIFSLSTNATDYTVSMDVPDLDPQGTGLTEWRLRHAGTAFPAGLKDRYTQGAELVGSDGIGLLNDIKSWAKSTGIGFDTEYDVAKAMQTYLHGPNFTYNTDISALMPSCTGLSTVDCFARIREGFCEQYATTMTMLMRMEGYPARFVEGYLQGAVDHYSLIEQVTTQQKHAWVEVYFPTYGWIPFDPTGGGIGVPTTLVPGSAVTAAPSPSESIGPDDTSPDTNPSRPPTYVPGGGTTTPDNQGPLILVPFILVLILALALFVVWRRRSRRLESADQIYRNIVRLASRVGYKPRPTQTIYEYTGMLAEVVPRARESLGVVAMATVDVTYGKRQLSAERLMFMTTAHKMIRQALLRLTFKRPKIRERSRDASRPRGGRKRR